MHATLHRFEGLQGSDEEIVRAMNRLAALLSRMTGFVSFALLETGEREYTAIVIFETEADLAAADEFFACWAVEELAGRLSGPPTAATGEVVVQRGM